MADQSSKANAAEAAERSKSEALAAAEKGSPVVTLLAKRIRAAKKRLGKIESMEKLRDSGKPMNADQVGCSSMCMARAKLCMHSQRPRRPLDQDHHLACPFWHGHLILQQPGPCSAAQTHTDRFLQDSSSAQIRSNALARVPCWVQRAGNPSMTVTDASAGGHTGKQDAHAGGHRGVGEAGASAEGGHPTAGSCCQDHAHLSNASGLSAAWQSPREPAQMGTVQSNLVWLRMRVSVLLHSVSARLPAGAHN